MTGWVVVVVVVTFTRPTEVILWWWWQTQKRGMMRVSSETEFLSQRGARWENHSTYSVRSNKIMPFTIIECVHRVVLVLRRNTVAFYFLERLLKIRLDGTEILSDLSQRSELVFCHSRVGNALSTMTTTTHISLSMHQVSQSSCDHDGRTPK
jgi:hypothetical protein